MTATRIVPVSSQAAAPAREASGQSDYARVERALRFLEAHVSSQPRLEEVAAEVGLSVFHFQRLFQRWAGVSPKRFLQFLTLHEAKRCLSETRSLLEASLHVGLSGPSRLHDLFLSLEGMTPGEYKARGRGQEIRWAVEETPFGPALFAAIERGLCGLSFVGDAGEAGALEELTRRWPEATRLRAPAAVRVHAEAFRARMAGKVDRPLGLVLKGTPLQLRVWEALLRIPPGHLATYGDVAKLAGAPRATRAVASAIAQNPIACLIPCHRVIQSTGAFGEYHWGAVRKRALIAFERSRPEASASAD